MSSLFQNLQNLLPLSVGFAPLCERNVPNKVSLGLQKGRKEVSKKTVFEEVWGIEPLKQRGKSQLVWKIQEKDLTLICMTLIRAILANIIYITFLSIYADLMRSSHFS